MTDWADRSYRVQPLDFWHYSLQCYTDPFVELRVDFAAHLDEAALREALACSCVTLPLIACGFSANPIRLRWIPRREAALELLRVVDVQGRKEEAALEAFEEPLDIRRGPQLRATILRDAQRDSLHLKVNHMVCDAIACQQYVTLLAGLYSRIVEGKDPDPAPFCPERGPRTALKGLTLWQRLKTLFTSDKIYHKSIIAAYVAGPSSFKEGPLAIVTASLSAEEFRAMRAASKAQGFTVNDTFMAALSIAWSQVSGLDKLLLPCSLDIRAFASPEIPPGLTNLTNVRSCIVDVTPQTTREDVRAQISEQMRVYKGGVKTLRAHLELGLLFGFVPHQIAGKVIRHLGKPYRITCSNLGIVSEDCVSFGSVPTQYAYLTASSYAAPAFTVRFSTFRDVATITLNIRGDEEAQATARAVVAVMRDELVRFGSSSVATS